MKGDTVEIIYRVGDKAEKLTLKAVKAGHSVRVNQQKFTTQVMVEDKNGNARQTASFANDSLIGYIEKPAG
jgi:hypothetical protein